MQQAYFKMAEGDWIDNPKCFLGAVLTMHEIMLEHTITLLTSCLKIITKHIEVIFTALNCFFTD
jgi:hypothetical protein